MEDFPMDLKGIYAVLIHPGVHMSTAEAYRLLQPQPASFDLKGLNNLPRQTWKDYVKNDFESAVASVHPIIAEIKDLFYQKGAFYASMSGSGSTVYGLFEGEVSFQSQWPNASIWQGYLID